VAPAAPRLDQKLAAHTFGRRFPVATKFSWGREKDDEPMKTRILTLLITGLLAISAQIVTTSVRAKVNWQRETGSELDLVPQTPAPNSQQQTVEQTQKNIKVLTGMPSSQLLPVMEYFETSLGVRCDFCHVNKNGQWDFVSDEKPEKSTARTMIQMVLDTNKNVFRGNVNVSCYTCHRGRTSPQGAPALPLTGKPLPLNQALRPKPEPAPSLPAAADILNKYVLALGGEPAIANLKSRTLKGTITQLNGITDQPDTFQFVFEQVAPDKFHQVITTAQLTLETAFDGLHGWQKARDRVREITGDELAGLTTTRGLFSQLKLKEQFASLRVEAKDRIGAREVYVLTGRTTADRRQRLYFDMQTGLLLRRIYYLSTIMGEIPEVWDFEDYRAVDGVQFPFILRISSIDSGTPVSTRNVTEMKTNIPVDESTFRMPAAVNANKPRSQ